MKTLGYILGAVSLVWLWSIAGADFPAPFWRHALIILGGVIIGIVGILFSFWLIHKSEERRYKNYERLMTNRRSKLIQQCAEILSKK